MAAMGKAGAFSMLAETAEEFIQLECARRRNQASLRRRSSLPSQFHVSGHKSRLREKLAQSRRHAFLLRADNKAALVGIIDNVRELATTGDEGGDGSKTSQLSNGPSPLERDRFVAWAADVEKLLFEFEPSENHANDPLLQILEHLQFLQDGHVCLAEVAMDARALLERWDRSGVFDSESSSEDEEDGDEHDAHHGDHQGFLGTGTVKDSTRHLEQSYAYQNIRQRAAASIIKRNVLVWVRSKASFCQRVAEIEVFGRTTEALLKELSLTSAALAGASTTGSTDIFALATGRCDPKARYSGSIAFKDLLQFSKHLALFPVDQALRTVEDVTRRRYLYDSRCAMKIQFVWRRVRETVRARRLRRAMEELRLQREQEAQAKREAAKEAKKRKASESVKRKAPKSQLKQTSTTRSPSLTAPPTPAPAPASAPAIPATPGTVASPKEESPPQTRESVAKRKQSSPPVAPIDVSSPRASTRGSLSSPHDDRPKPPTSTPRSRQRASRGTGANNNDSDDDTTDVEAAWKSFMDTVAADVAVQEVSNGDGVNEAPEEESIGAPIPPVTLPPMEDNWEAWSDDETDIGNNDAEVHVDRPQSSTKPRSPSAVPTPRMKVVVAVNKSSLPDPLARRASRRDSTTPREHSTRPAAIPSTSVIRPPSSLPFDATLQNHTGPYTGAGQLSLMAPFIDADRSKKAQSTVAPERKHLYELDFTGAKRDDAAIARVANVLSSPIEPEVQPTPRPKTPEKLGGAPGPATDAPRASSRRTTVARLRSITGEQEQTERIRHVLDTENRDAASHARRDVSSPTTPRADTNSSLQAANKPGFFVYGAQGVNVHREVVLRKGTMVYSPLNGPPDENPANPAEPGAKEVKSWHRSTIAAIPQVLATPRPPADRFHPRHKRRLKGPQRQTISGIADELQAIEASTSKPTKRGDKRSEFPLLLRRSRAATRRRELERSDNFADASDADLLDIPAPDISKQMWKRGGELPELALAQIRDRVGYKRRSSHHKRLSIIAGRAPPSGLQVDKISADEEPETIFPVEEERSDDEEHDACSDGNDSPNEIPNDVESETRDANLEQQSNDDDVINGLEREDSALRKKSEQLTEEFRRLHLSSRERELTRRQSLLAQLQNEEDAVKGRQRSNEDVKGQRRRRESERERGEASDSAGSDDSDAGKRALDWRVDGLGSRGRRRLRVKTRDASVNLYEELSDEEDAAESEEEDVRRHTGMTEKERGEAFQTLLTQYLGLLQCAPPLPRAT